MSYIKRDNCSSCSSANLTTIYSFGQVPLAGYFPKINELPDLEKYPLTLCICNECSLIQVVEIVPSSVLFEDYRYLSSIGLTGYYQEVAFHLYTKLQLNNQSNVVEIGSNDGVLQEPFKKLGILVTGFEPAINIAKVAKSRGLQVINDYFNSDTIKGYFHEGSVDCIIANNVFAHINTIKDILKGIRYLLCDSGVFVFEVHNTYRLFIECQYDFIYHEHLFYYTIESIRNLLVNNGLYLHDLEYSENHSGSYRVYARKRTANFEESIQLDSEKDWKINLENFIQHIDIHKHSVLKFLNEIVQKEGPIIGFGASGRANVFCNFIGINTSMVSFIFDESEERTDRLIPGVNIPVVKFESKHSDIIYETVLIFAWNYFEKISKKVKAKKFIVLFPKPKIIINENIGSWT